MIFGIWIKDLVDMENNIFHFENLVAYQRGLELVTHVYEVIKNFPREEQYALCDQLRRACVSIPSNLVEGMSRTSSKEQLHFIEFAYGSLCETMCQLEIAYELNFIGEDDLKQAEARTTAIAQMLSGLRNKRLT